jgi:uncharacterized protein
MPTTLTIRSVSDAEIRIGDDLYTETVALTGDTVFEDWPVKRVGDLTDSDFSRLFEVSPEIIVLGTGAENLFPPRELVFAMARRGIGFEVMDTRAAARTFNVLAGEGRNVTAVLYVGEPAE